MEQRQTTLFNFKTFRSPDRIDENQKDKYFINHPNFAASAFSLIGTIAADGSKVTSDGVVASLHPASSYRIFLETYPEFYKFSCTLMLQKRNAGKKAALPDTLPQPLSNQDYIDLWEELLTQIVTQESNTVRHACEQMIITQHYLTHANELQPKDISKLVIVIPAKIIDILSELYGKSCTKQLFGVYNLGVQDYRRVEQTLCCYVPGEVSHIENIMAREFKEKSTRNTLKTEQSSETTTESTIENINDTTTAERNEMSSEIAKILQKDKAFDVSGSVTVSKDSKIFGSFSSNVNTGYSSNSSSSLSNTEAKNYAKEVTERAQERIEQKISEKRTYKIIKEYEEIDKHGYDNRLGSQHVTGVYRWVDKIYKNQLKNYGKRMVMEVEVPHPAMLYKKALQWKNKNKETAQNTPIPPKTLAEFGIHSSGDINADIANQAALAYGTTIQNYETETQYVNLDIPVTNVERKTFSQSQALNSINIPSGFVAEKISGAASFNFNGSQSNKAYIQLFFGGYCAESNLFDNNGTSTFNFDFNFNPNLGGSISVVVKYRQTNNYSASLNVKCVSDPMLFRDWQDNTYNSLVEAYQQKLDEYNDLLAIQQAAAAAEAAQAESENYSNEAANRLIEERELKRSCIEMLGRPYCHELGKSFHTCKSYSCNTCEKETVEANVPEISPNEGLERYAEMVRFFETAFQWELMSYTFYPYYYNPKCIWYELMQIKSDDPIFEAFLQSGMAKVLVPVRPQFESAVLWYLDSGEIYLEGDITSETEDDHNLSLIDEMQHPEDGVVEDEWTTQIPSTLTIIQARSSYLEDEDGLPCDCGVPFFSSGTQVLQGLDNQGLPSPTEEEDNSGNGSDNGDDTVNGGENGESSGEGGGNGDENGEGDGEGTNTDPETQPTGEE
jgi:hypothetical protein